MNEYKHLYQNYYLTTDKLNYILVKRLVATTGKNKGSEYFERIAYFGRNLKFLYNALIDLLVLENIRNDNYDELLNMIKEVIKLKEVT